MRYGLPTSAVGAATGTAISGSRGRGCRARWLIAVFFWLSIHPAVPPAVSATGSDGPGVIEARSSAAPRVIDRVPVPEGFLGNLAYDAEADRLFLVSLGPPSIDWPAGRLIEVERKTGAVLRQADLPFRGSYGAPAVVRGDLLQAIYVRSELHRIETGIEGFGRTTKVADLPRVPDLPGAAERHRLRFPYLEIQALAAAPASEIEQAGAEMVEAGSRASEGGGPHLVLQASGIGELVTIDVASGDVVARAEVDQGLSGLARVPGQRGKGWLLAGLDTAASEVYSKVRGYNPRGSENGAVTKRSKSAFHARRDGEIRVRWLLLEAASGRALASTGDVASAAWAGNLEVIRHFDDSGPFGRLHVLALGPEGILTLEWVP